jgi:hypothetical protein
MSKEKRQSPRRLGRRTAFQSIFNAFRWLADRGSTNHRANWLGDYPLLISGSPRNAFLAFEFLCRPSEQREEPTIAVGPTDYVTFINTNGSSEGSSLKEGFVALTYLEAQRGPGDLGIGSLLQQQEQIRQLFKEKYGSEHVLMLRSDNLHSNGDNSVRESITNLICAEFFMLKGYMVLADCGSGPDLIAFKTKLVDQLRERKFIGQGASISQLATIRAFGRETGGCRESDAGEEVIAVETESVNPQKGVEQLRNGYGSERFSYLGFFDRKVIAAPFLSQRYKDLDVFTYDTSGIEYWGCDKDHPASDFWRSKKLQFMKEVHESMKVMLLMNLTHDEIARTVSSKPLTTYAMLQEAMSLEISGILDMIEGNL